MSKINLFKNIFSLGSVQIINYIFPLITVPYISRIIGPEGYGILNYSTAFISYFTLLISYGFDLTGTRRIAQNSNNLEKITTVVSEVITSRTILYVISIVAFLFLVHFFEPISKNKLVTIILFIGTISSVISPQYIFQGMQKLTIFAKLNFIKGVINTVLIFIIIKKPDDYILIAVLNSFFSITINIFLYFYANKLFGVRYKFCTLNNALNVLNKEKLIFLSTVTISLYTTTNIVVLGIFVDPKEVGYYTTSIGFINILNLVINAPISKSLYPFISNAFASSKEYGIEIVKKILPTIMYLTFLASIFLLIFAPSIINLFYGKQFELSIPSLRIISFIPFIVGLSNVFGIQIILNLGLDRLFFRVTAIASIFGVALNIFMSKNYGYIGTAWNSIIVECFVTIMMYITLKKSNIKIFDLKYFNPKRILLFQWNHSNMLLN